jgi:hypothetical protein
MTASYEQDFGLWAEQMANLLASGRFSELDIENLVEEVRDLSKRERDRLLSSLRLILYHLLKWDYQPQKRSRSWHNTIGRERNNVSSLRLILYHLLKWDYQPQKRSRSWHNTIGRERNNVSLYLEDSPSLSQYLNEDFLNKMYRVARSDAMRETGLEFPSTCPYGIEDVLNRSIFLSEK